MNAQAKTINLLLYDGSLNGVISIEDSGWNSGELYSAPREAVSDLLKTDACKKFGVYLLLSKEKVYIGQSSDLAKRLSQHIIGKEWWESAVILTTNNDSLNHSDIDYIEYVLIEKAFAIERLDCDNKKKGNPPKVDKFRKVVLEQYLEEALFLMQLIGIDVFSENKAGKHKKTSNGNKSALIETIVDNNKSLVEMRAKAEAVQFLMDRGIKLEKKINYAAIQAGKNVFWLNPNVSCLENDWSLILNDINALELIVLRVPEKSLSLSSAVNKGLKVRNDQPKRIDLKISSDSLIDMVSKVDFSKYVIKRIKY